MLDLAKKLIDFIIHIDAHLSEIVAACGAWTYGVIFLIIFVETGLVIMPFLPGDSLLFATGALCALPDTGLNIHLMALLLFLAAFLGDTVNYWVGRRIGPAVFNREDSVWLRKKHLERAHAFFEKYGGRAVILARFAPFVRTFVPFIAGVGAMSYRRFLAYNLIGGFLWIYSFLYLGYFFGNLPLVKKNFGLVIVAIIILSIMPMIFELVRAWLQSRRAPRSAA